MDASSKHGGCAAAVMHVPRLLHLKAASNGAAKQHSRNRCGPRATFLPASSPATDVRSHQKIDVVHAQTFIASGLPKLALD
jgi:hypothetical protein